MREAVKVTKIVLPISSVTNILPIVFVIIGKMFYGVRGI